MAPKKGESMTSETAEVDKVVASILSKMDIDGTSTVLHSDTGPDEKKIEHKVVESLMGKMGESSNSNQFTQSEIKICSVVNKLRSQKPSAYIPKRTSIGPLHREDQRLTTMETHKSTCMKRLFQRTVESKKDNMEKISNISARDKILEHVKRAKACYQPSPTNYDDSKLAEMLVIDGCFILELLYTFKYEKGEHDPKFEDVKDDLLLLENQIPFFILEILFSLTVERVKNEASLTELISCFFKDMHIVNKSTFTPTVENEKPRHILGFFQSCYRPKLPQGDQLPADLNNSYSASQIAKVGVKFKAELDDNSLLAVKFQKSPSVEETCFKIPELCIKKSTPSLLRNLIAYEQCDPSSGHYVTSFAILMSKLIVNKDDVSLLKSSQVLQDNDSAKEDTATLFKDICNGVDPQEFYYSKEWEQLHKYCKSPIPPTATSKKSTVKKP